ncbi:MAG: alanine dehydrogenase [Flavobacteriia bacterium]|nr:alanine dehydrogenase [Flavobacteriia bacterium]
MKLGIIREGKVPPDKRVPLTPKQCKQLEAKFPNVKIIVQPSPIRAYKDDEYIAEGITVQEDLTECSIIAGVKEVNISDLIPNKKFMFFSHTLKKQSYNRKLLQAILEKNIQLIDYEALKNKENKRIIGFGRYAGIVGTYNGFLTYGLKHKLYTLKHANQCSNRIEVEEELKKVVLPADTRIVLTGFGRVGNGAREIMDLLPIKEVSPEEYLAGTFNEPIFTQLEVEDYYGRKDGKPFDKKDFYTNPSEYKSTFSRFLENTDMYIPCHFWSDKSPYIITRQDLKNPNNRLSVVADISCDIDSAIGCTIRPSTIIDPIYGYNPITESEDDMLKEGVIAVMAVDNLPCELPLDASEDFGNTLLKYIFPAMFIEDPDLIIDRGSETTLNGELSSYFTYLKEYVKGETVNK